MIKRYLFIDKLLTYKVDNKKMRCDQLRSSSMCKCCVNSLDCFTYVFCCKKKNCTCSYLCLKYREQFNFAYYFNKQSGIFFYYIAYIILAILGYWNPIFSSILLIDIFRQFPQLNKILQSVWIPKK